MKDHRNQKLCIEICYFHWAKSYSVKNYISQKVEISGSIKSEGNTEKSPENLNSETEEKKEYEGPITRAKFKALEQANILMAQYFDT